MKKIFSQSALFLTGLAAGMFVLMLFAFNENNDKKPGGSPSDVVNTDHNWISPPLPDAIDFAGEATPLDRWEVKEQLDREVLFNYYWESNILYMLKLAGRYFPLIEERLKANGIPEDFKYLCIAESNLSNAISRAGATGFWQFMRGTAPGYGMEISTTVDERYNVLKSTDAACKYLKQAYEKFGSWTAAAASYNCGMGGYQNAVNFQGTSYYYDLLLPEETQRYIFRILAFKYLLTNAKQLGYQLSEQEQYEPVGTRSIIISKSIPNLSIFARENGTTYKMLRWLNPWLRSRSLHVKTGKTYTILLPA
jgi:membrane-bound lytic murein transglycosylase D